MTIGRMETMRGAAGKVMSLFADQNDNLPQARNGSPRMLAPLTNAVPVEIQERPANLLKVMAQVFSSAWVPLQTAGIVLVVLIFLLLEHEAFRDRFIRLAGGKHLRATTAAINDAGERLSRYFVSQFAVNFGVGAVIWAGLASIGFPQAILWAALTAILRFVPYVGVLVAALSAGLLAAAVDQGWSLMIMTLGLYVIVEIVATQLIEPELYGHTTGLSPLSVVIAVIFWSWLWGPVGLVVSTPLTLCLVVAGRHIKALNFLDILLGDAPALTMPQRFYQRALSGDSDEIIAAARVFLQRRSFAAYCDSVLMRAMRLAHLDWTEGTISDEQQRKVGSAIATVIEALDTETGRRSRRHRHTSVLDDPNLGRYLRRQREGVSGRWQGPLVAPPGSVVLGVGLGSVGDDLATELLVRILRDLYVDARHLPIEDVEAAPPPSATPDSVSMVCIVSVAPEREQERGALVAAEVRRRFPEACIAAVLLPWAPTDPELVPFSSNVDLVASSFEEVTRLVIARFQGKVLRSE
jgi:predicted PurR-regulated permease PerM